MSNLVAKYALGKGSEQLQKHIGPRTELGKSMDKHKGKNPMGKEDPFFAWVEKPNGKLKKVKKQIPDYLSERDAAALGKAKKTAYFWDMSINLCFCRFGWSSVIGLIPELGDLIEIGFALQVYRLCCDIDGGMPQKQRRRMLKNIAVDFFVGLIPILGDLADAFYKCNTRNVMVMEEHLRAKYTGKSEGRQAGLVDVNDENVAPHNEKFAPQETGTVAAPPLPARGHTQKPKSGGRWFSQRERRPDVEMGR